MTIEKANNFSPPMLNTMSIRDAEGSNPDATRLASLVTRHLECSHVTVSDPSNISVNSTSVVAVVSEKEQLEKVYQSAAEKLMGLVTAKAASSGNQAWAQNTKGPFARAVKWLGNLAGESASKSHGTLPPPAIQQILKIDELGLNRDDFVGFLIAFDLSREVDVTFTDAEQAELHSLFTDMIGRLTGSSSAVSSAIVNARMSTALQDLTERLATELSKKAAAA